MKFVSFEMVELVKDEPPTGAASLSFCDTLRMGMLQLVFVELLHLCFCAHLVALVDHHY